MKFFNFSVIKMKEINLKNEIVPITAVFEYSFGRKVNDDEGLTFGSRKIYGFVSRIVYRDTNGEIQEFEQYYETEEPFDVTISGLGRIFIPELEEGEGYRITIELKKKIKRAGVYTLYVLTSPNEELKFVGVVVPVSEKRAKIFLLEEWARVVFMDNVLKSDD